MNARVEPGRSVASGHPLAHLPTQVLMGLVTVYRMSVGWMFAGSCRFVPSCSAYASEALARHGALRGSWLTVRRVLRCHPLSRGGLDQVPLVGRSGDRMNPGIDEAPGWSGPAHPRRRALPRR